MQKLSSCVQWYGCYYINMFWHFHFATFLRPHVVESDAEWVPGLESLIAAKIGKGSFSFGTAGRTKWVYISTIYANVTFPFHITHSYLKGKKLRYGGVAALSSFNISTRNTSGNPLLFVCDLTTNYIVISLFNSSYTALYWQYLTQHTAIS